MRETGRSAKRLAGRSFRGLIRTGVQRVRVAERRPKGVAMKHVGVSVTFLCLFLTTPVWAAGALPCPCASDPTFASFLDGSRVLITCTDDNPFYPFVRVDAADYTLAVVTAI